MKLEIGKIMINEIRFGEKSQIKSGVLIVNKAELIELIAADKDLESVALDITKPGDETRIIPVKDVIEPRVKVEGEGEIFPGLLGSVETVGSGRTHVLKGAAVVTTGRIVGFQEGIIDMSGEGAKYTPFSKLNNLVMTCEPAAGIDSYAHEEAIRMAGLKAAAYLGKLAKDLTPDEVETFETKPLLQQAALYPELPKVVYVYMLQSQGLLHDTYVYGVDAKKIIPTFIYPTEIFDGAVLSGNCVSACDKNPSYVHLNHPIIEDLYARDGKDFNFLGCVITNENVFLADKHRSSNMTAKLVEFLGADAVIISEEGFGNPDADLVMNCNKISAKGIKTVLMTDEYAGQDGASQSLADSTPAGDAVVTGGNANQLITLKPMKKVIGHPAAADVVAGGHNGSLQADGTIRAEIQLITGSTSEVGFHNLSAKTV
ncbi:MAG: glycine/sarcosine/betaine reductase component B subunit [Candidatus Cloacimonadales bacterium]